MGSESRLRNLPYLLVVHVPTSIVKCAGAPGAALLPPFEHDMGCETASMPDVSGLQLRYGHFSLIYLGEYARLGIMDIERVIGSMPGALQSNESLGEVLDFRREISQRLRILTSPSCVAVLQGTIRLMPSIVAPSPHERIRNRGS